MQICFQRLTLQLLQGQQSYFESDIADKWLKVGGLNTFFSVTIYNFNKVVGL